MSPYRPEFEDALRLFARASRAMTERGFAAPVLVGGAAVELYTAGAVTTGDLDVVTGWQDEFEAQLRSLGFTKPAGLGRTPLGWVHPELRIGFEIVSAALLDGMADRDRVAFIAMGGDGTVSVISVEDMIADRMGQYASEGLRTAGAGTFAVRPSWRCRPGLYGTTSQARDGRRLWRCGLRVLTFPFRSRYSQPIFNVGERTTRAYRFPAMLAVGAPKARRRC